MNIAAVLIAIVEAIAEREGSKLLAWLESKLPGSVAAFVQHVLGQQSTQDWLKAEEAKAAAVAGKFTAEGLQKIEDAILAHVHGPAGDFVRAQIAKLGAVTFSPEQAAQLQMLAAAGKLPELLSAGMKDLGLA